MWPTFYIPDGTSFPNVPLVCHGDLGCNASINAVPLYFPDHAPCAQVGDFAIVVTVQNTGGFSGSFTSPCQPPTGWNWLHKAGAPGGRAGASVFYKFLEEADLTTTVYWTHAGAVQLDGTGAGVGYICGHVWVFRGVDTDLPIDHIDFHAVHTLNTGNTDFSRGCGDGGAAYVPSNAMWIFDVLDTTPTGTYTAVPDELARVGAVSEEGYQWRHVAANSGSTSMVVAGPSRGYYAAGENLITGESWTSTLTNWTPVGCTRNTSTTLSTVVQCAEITSTGGAPAYCEYSIALEEGEWYSYNVMFENADGYYSLPDYMYASVVDPNNAEIGASWLVRVLTPAYIGDTAATFGANRGTEWGSCLWVQRGDGVPTRHTNCHTIWFRAATAGTYKLRVGMTTTNGVTGTSITGAQQRQISAVSLYKGFVAAAWNPAGETDSDRTAAPFYWFEDGYTGTGQVYHLRFVINKAGTPEPAKMRPLFNDWEGSRVTGDDLLTVSRLSLDMSPDGVKGAQLDRCVLPTIGGVAQKYYAETTITALTGTAAVAQTVVRASRRQAEFGDNDGVADYCYLYAKNGQWNDGATAGYQSGKSTYTTGDVIGVAVDYSTGYLTFYKNGVSEFTAAIDTTLPHVLAVGNFSGGNFRSTEAAEVSVNVRGPFSYKPSGFSAWDIHNEVV